MHHANIGFSCVVIRLTSRFCSPITVGRANDDTQSGILVSGNRVDVTYDCNVSPLRTAEREPCAMETAKSDCNEKRKKERGLQRGGKKRKGTLTEAVVLLIGAFRRHSSWQIAGCLDIMTKKTDICFVRCVTDTLVKSRFIVKWVRIVAERLYL